MQKPEESVVITLPDGTEIIVTVIAMERNRVRMGYSAPRYITIDREEVHDRKMLEQGAEVNGNVA
jgi:carbon storage regulator CsrA